MAWLGSGGLLRAVKCKTARELKEQEVFTLFLGVCGPLGSSGGSIPDEGS